MSELQVQNKNCKAYILSLNPGFEFSTAHLHNMFNGTPPQVCQSLLLKGYITRKTTPTGYEIRGHYVRTEKK